MIPTLDENRITFKITKVDGEHDSDHDMESAIERSSHSWANDRFILQSREGLTLHLSNESSRTTYSFVDGYNEGEENLGGEQSKPPREAESCQAELRLPAKDAVFSVTEFKSSIGEMRNLKDCDDDYALSAGSANVMEVADTLLKINHADGDARSYWPGWVDEPSFGKKVSSFDSEFAKQLLGSIPSDAVVGGSVQIHVPSEMSAFFVEMSKAAQQITHENSKVKLDNMVNAAQARVSLKIDSILDESENAAPSAKFRLS